MFNKINWKVRFKNPVFLAQVAIAVISPVLVGLGLRWEDMTNWGVLFDALYRAVSNPVIVAASIASLWGVITDPTTKGTKDSEQALTYKKPKQG